MLIEISFAEPGIGTWATASMKQIPGATNKCGQVLRIYHENPPSPVTLSFRMCQRDVRIFHTQSTLRPQGGAFPELGK